MAISTCKYAIGEKKFQPFYFFFRYTWLRSAKKGFREEKRGNKK